jgi:alcohol dehydrogenase
MLLEIVQAQKIDPALLITHRFKFADIIEAYETFTNAEKTKAIKVLIGA